MKRILGSVVAVATIVSVAAGAWAQGAKPAAPVLPNDPQRTTASFGDWTLSCVRLADGVRACEVASAVVGNAQGQSGTIAQIAIGRPAKGQPLRLTLALPNNVSFGAVAKVALDEKSKALVETTWRRCLPGACYADAVIDQAALTALRERAEPARITFRDGTDQEVGLPLSTRGLAQSLDALAKEAS